MSKSIFNEMELLSQGDLIYRIQEILDEFSRRDEANKEFLRTLCNLSVETRVWWILFEAGGAQRFTDIFHVAGCSRAKLILVLRELIGVGLVRVVEKRYQAMSP